MARPSLPLLMSGPLREELLFLRLPLIARSFFLNKEYPWLFVYGTYSISHIKPVFLME